METTAPKPKPGRPTKEKRTFTRAEVAELLQKQLQAAADKIQGNVSEYCAKKTIRETGPIDF